MNIFVLRLQEDTEMEFVKTSLKVFNFIKSMSDPSYKLTNRPRLMDVLTFYFLYGYSSKTKKLIVASLGITPRNLDQINSQLYATPYLIRDDFNYTVWDISDELKEFKEYLLSGDKNKNILVNVKA